MQKRKSPYCRSATGRMPIIADPTHTPASMISEIGVFKTRSYPNSSPKPLVTVKAPPIPPGMSSSSPRQNTSGSRRISSAIARFKASAIDSKAIIYPPSTRLQARFQSEGTERSARTRQLRRFPIQSLSQASPTLVPPPILEKSKISGSS
ncbi:hypothetical protein SDC9_194826 [bioreactor metagenome]|uniref:Uncharacterized protein n=1 Tax=bioreactor metagenome TaxID=1076179 RepID=A0A645I7C2_9ZZZZ